MSFPITVQRPGQVSQSPPDSCDTVMPLGGGSSSKMTPDPVAAAPSAFALIEQHQRGRIITLAQASVLGAMAVVLFVMAGLPPGGCWLCHLIFAVVVMVGGGTAVG
eukprot:RCo027262